MLSQAKCQQPKSDFFAAAPEIFTLFVKGKKDVFQNAGDKFSGCS